MAKPFGNILLVDGDEGFRCAATKILEHAGFAVVVTDVYFPTGVHGSGISADLADKARKMGIPIWRFTEDGAA